MALTSYVHGQRSTPLLNETIGANLFRTVKRFGEHEALVAPAQGYRATYQQLWDATTALARALLARGIDRGDRVGIWAPNRFEWVLIQYATARIGAILVNINPAYKTAELHHALNQSGVTLLIMSRGFRQTDYVDILERVRPECPTLHQTVVLEDDWTGFLEDGRSVNTERLVTREAALTFDDPINIQYTSGTTGVPKGATLSHHNILNNGFFCGEVLGYDEQDRVCVPVPFYHCFGMVIGNLACTSHGSCIITPGGAFDPGLTLATLAAERCTSLYGVPTMFIAQLDHPDFAGTDFSSLRTGVMAGSPCPVEVMKRVRERMHMPEITICYGMTETSPVSTQTRVDDAVEKRVATVGSVHPHVEVQIIDPDTGRVVSRGQPGELCTRGYSVMQGYWNDPSSTRAAIDGDRWMHTGDLASMDEDGYIRIVGRMKDMIIRGGENIYPREIEEYLYTHPGVAEVQVVGVPSEHYGEEVVAWIKPMPNVRLDGDTLKAFCRGAIATYKIPRYWKIVDLFPMTVTGKVQKYRMREISEADLQQSDNDHPD